MKQFTCIICPRGCSLNVDENNNVTGNFCPRGKAYALSEITDPRRTVTSTVVVSNRNHLLCSVKTNKPVPKDKMFDVITLLKDIKIEAPCNIGDIVVKNIFDLDIDIIVTKNIK